MLIHQLRSCSCLSFHTHLQLVPAVQMELSNRASVICVRIWTSLRNIMRMMAREVSRYFH